MPCVDIWVFTVKGEVGTRNFLLYPTYDIDQSYRQGNIRILDIALWYTADYYRCLAQWSDSAPSAVWNNALVHIIVPVGGDILTFIYIHVYGYCGSFCKG